MKIKEIERTVNTSWSPADHHPILLAAGTAAQQIDASFNTSAALEIYSLNLQEPTLDLELKASVPSTQRFHKISWGGTTPGIIVGGCDNGIIQMYNVSKLLAKEDGYLTSPERHAGPVRALDFNPFQKNLLATGASSSEIFIWDINNTGTPMTPGSKSQPFEDVTWLAWNQQVQYILASTFPTRCVVWDLRKNEPIIKLSDTTTRVRWKVVAWHPEVATQLCLASEEDTSPVIQLWDLRFASAPTKTFHGHTRGILSLAWCSKDPDLLISSGKDNKILCWNPNTPSAEGEIICEIPNSQQWIFDVSWCPRNPSLIVSSSCDGRTGVYSLTGSGHQISNSKIADSFPGMSDYADPHVHPAQATVDLKKAPKWLKKSGGVRFGFGGKLVSFGQDGVKLFQVHVDDGFLDKARQLEQRLAEGRFYEICQGKQDPVWRYLEASFSPQPRNAIMNLLGYDKDAVLKLLNITPKQSGQNNIDHLTAQFGSLNKENYDQTGYENSNYINNDINGGGDLFENISTRQAAEKEIPFKILTGDDVEGKVCKAILIGGVLEAIDICLSEGKMADALVLAMTAGPEVLAKTQLKYFQKREGFLTNIISALVSEDWRPVVRNCELQSWKEALTAVLTYCPDEMLPSLCQELGARLEEAGGEYLSPAEICYIASGHVAPLIQKRTSGVKLTSENIQELVELVLVAQGATSSHGQSFQITGDVAKLIALYSEILAGEGDLNTALQFLSDSKDDNVVELRERLYYALGIKTLFSQASHAQQQQQQQQAVQSSNIIRKTSFQGMQQPPLSSSYGKSAPAPITPHMAPQPATSQNYGMPSMPMQNTTPSGPPPPQSSFSRNTPSPQVQGTTMKKYVLDPSVGGGGYHRSSQMFSSQATSPAVLGTTGYQQGMPPNVPSYSQNFQPPSSTFQPPISSSNFQNPTSSFLPHQPPVSNFQTSFAPNSTSTPSHGGQTQQPLSFPGTGHQPLSFPGQQPQSVPQQLSPTPLKPPLGAQSQDVSMFTPQQNVAYNQPGGLSINRGHEMPSSQHLPASGWNDPPFLSSRNNQPKPEPPPQQNPITHPIFGTAPPVGPEGPANPSPMSHQAQPPSMQHQIPPTAYGEPPISMGIAAEPSKPKTAMPQQYIHIQTTFEDLKNKCSLASNNNAMTRRKLEDVSRKLETLYDFLRDGVLSPSAISGLEQLVQCVEASDFPSGQGVISRMVSGTDFSQVSAFTTGLKILLQTAQQLRVN